MNTPKALAELFQIAKLANTATEIEELRRLKGQLLAGGDQLGLLQADPEDWFSRSAHALIDTAEIERLIAERNATRSAKNYPYFRNSASIFIKTRRFTFLTH